MTRVLITHCLDQMVDDDFREYIFTDDPKSPKLSILLYASYSPLPIR